MQETPEDYFKANREQILSRLLEYLRIPSISTDPRHGPDIARAAAWVADQLRAAGPLTVEVVETAGHPVVYAEWLGAPGRPTLLVYGHYDVQPVDPLDQWRSPPFAPEIREGRIYARGVSDDKGPMLIPIVTAEAFFATVGQLPINLKLVFEGEEEIGSPHLEEFMTRHAARLAADYALSADGAMWRSAEPSLAVGSRGILSFELELRGPGTDLHSGRHGGAVLNPLHALADLIAGLHSADGRVAVAGFYEAVRGVTAEERRQIAALAFDDRQYLREIGAPALFGEQGYSTLERQWLRPTLEVNGLYGGYQGSGSKTVIPAVAQAKISCRLVADQQPGDVLQAIRRHLEAHCPPGVALRVIPHPGSAPAYRIDRGHPGLGIARRVLRDCYGVEAIDVWIGGTLPVCDTFRRVLGLDTVFFSFSTGDENLHAPNEFFRLSRLWEGLAAWAAYWRLAGEEVQA